MFLAAFAKPLLCAGRFISTKLNCRNMSMFRLEDYDTATEQNDAEKDEIQEPSNCSCEDN
jgi:hypothetical protein